MSLTISCPNCSSRYLLPEHLLGPAGARVCCPACWHRFTVDAAGALVTPEVEPLFAEAAQAGAETAREVSPPGPEARTGAESAPAPAPSGLALTCAHEALAALDPVAPDLLGAIARGRMFAEFGPRVLEAFDRYREAAGPGSGAAMFRRALRERWEIDLPGVDAAEVGAESA